MGFWKRRVSAEEQGSMTPETQRQRLRERALSRLQLTLPSDSPSWVLNEAFDLPNNIMRLDIVMRIGPGWVKRRYRYDGEVDVLYFNGEIPFPETALDELPPERMVWPSHPLSRLSELTA
ncbi:MAG: hypothetical protein RMK32_05405 [Anaerolineae bacterium]|nr:hypothetical protein [Thermoflexus sp.]MDW8065049.1 hypothetical protein [Anaerolineae bacterium]